jgi:hypothetical protein
MKRHGMATAASVCASDLALTVRVLTHSTSPWSIWARVNRSRFL